MMALISSALSLQSFQQYKDGKKALLKSPTEIYYVKIHSNFKQPTVKTIIISIILKGYVAILYVQIAIIWRQNV